MNNINDINIYEAFKNMDLFESDIKKDIQNLNNTIDCLESCISEYKKRQAYFPIPLGYSPKSWEYFELKTSNFFYSFISYFEKKDISGTQIDKILEMRSSARYILNCSDDAYSKDMAESLNKIYKESTDRYYLFLNNLQTVYFPSLDKITNRMYGVSYNNDNKALSFYIYSISTICNDYKYKMLDLYSRISNKPI